MKTLKILTIFLFFFGLNFYSFGQCNANFTTTVYNNDSIVISNSSTPVTGVSYSWHAPGLLFVGGTDSTSTSPKLKTTVRGSYIIKLTTYGPGTCTSTKSVALNISIPNACSTATAIMKDSISNDTLFLKDLCTPAYQVGSSYLYWAVFPGKLSSNQWSPFAPNRTTFGWNSTFNKYHSPNQGLVAVYLYYHDFVPYCMDSVMKVVNLGPKSCSANFGSTISQDTVTFFNNSITSGQNPLYVWSFGDGNYSQQTSPQHIYSSPGTYQVCLLLNDTANNCADTLCKNVIVSGGCGANYSFTTTNDTAFFTNTSTTSGQSPLFIWNFGDGNGAFQAVQSVGPVHVYANAGNYNVCLYINDTANNCLDTICKTVIVSRCKADFTIRNQITSTRFTNTSNPISGSTFNWDFDSPFLQNSSFISAVKKYPVSGNYNVCLSIHAPSLTCRDTVCKIAKVCPIADWDYSTKGRIVQFHNHLYDTLSRIQYTWLFGTGATSTLTNPTYTYPNNQAFQVCLIKYDPLVNCSDTLCKTIDLTVKPCKAKANFLATNHGPSGTFTATDTSKNASGYYWSVGKYNSSRSSYSGKTVNHTYTSPGYYRVQLLAHDSIQNCEDTSLKIIYVDTITRCKADFTFRTSKDTAFFTNTSTTAGQNPLYLWNYGDGSSFSNQTVHIYANPGNYQVCLYINDTAKNCLDTICKTVSLTASCNASFTYGITNGDTIQVVNSSTPSAGLSYLWVAPGLTILNGTDTSENPLFFAMVRGNYKIRLIVTNSVTNCTDTQTVDLNINKGHYCSLLKTDFSYTINNKTLELRELCSPAVDTTNDILSWRIIDSTNIPHYSSYALNGNTNPVKFSAPKDGLYGVYLFYRDVTSRCFDSLIKVVELQKVIQPCKADFKINKREGGFYEFQDLSTVVNIKSSTRRWDFGDGKNHNTGFAWYNYKSHRYDTAATLTSRLIIEDTVNNCKDTAFRTLTIPKACHADFYFLQNRLSFSFLDYSNAKNPTSTFYKWDFGDGNIGLGKNKNHTYASNGTYNVCLFLTDTLDKCTDTICKTIKVEVKECYGNFIARQDKNGNVEFWSSYLPSNPDIKYLWTFEDNTTSTAARPTRNYPTSGKYNICLSIENTKTNCRDTSCSSIYICRNGVGCIADFSFTTNKLNSSFTNLSPNPSTSIKYLWVFGDGDTSSQTSPNHAYMQGGNYNVCLIRYDTANKCIDTACKVITVVGPPICSANFTDSNITHALVSFKNTSMVTGTNPSYLWNFGDTANLFYSAVNPQHQYALGDTFNVCLFLTDSTAGGVCRDTVCKNITIRPPKCKASFSDSSITNTYVQFKNTSTTYGANPGYLWNFGDVFNIFSFAKNPQHIYLNTGVFNVCLYIKDSTVYGVCRDTLCQSININYNQLGVAESSTGKSFSIYPNPSNGVFNLDWETEGENNSIIVYNSSGVMIKNLDEMDPNSYEKTIDLSDFPDGMYLIQLHGDSSVESVRVIKSN